MRKLLAACLVAAVSLLWIGAAPALADGVSGVIVVASCGNQSLQPWSQTSPTLGIITVDTTGKACVNASVSASITGFQPAANGTPISVTTSSTTGTLPAGTVVVASNVGTNGAFCTLGASTTASGQYIPPGGGWFAFTVGSATQLSCLTSSGSTTINMVGGTGLPTGTGGGGGSGGGGAITAAAGSYAAGALGAGALVDGADTTEGKTTDAPCTLPASTTACSGIALQKAAANAITGSIPAGTNTIGNVVPVPGSAGSCTPYHLANGTAASNNSTSIKGSAGTLCHILPINTTATVYYLKIYDSATAPTCSSATGLKHVYPIPAGSTGNGFAIALPFGETYSSGIGYCVTGGGSDTDNTNAATGVYIEASYK